MAQEMVCGNCQGRLMVEQTGVVVACPHCGAHLQIGDVPPPPMYQPQPDYSQPQYPPQNYAPQNYPYPNYPQHYPQNFAPPPWQPGQMPPVPQTPPVPPEPYPQFQAPSPQPDRIASPSAPIPESHRPEPAVLFETPPSPSQSPISEPASTFQFAPPPAPTPEEPQSNTWSPNNDVSHNDVSQTDVTTVSAPTPATEPAPTVPVDSKSSPTANPEPFSLSAAGFSPTTATVETLPVPAVSTAPPTEIWSAPQFPDHQVSSAENSAPANPTPEVAPALTPPLRAVGREFEPLPDFTNFGAQFAAKTPVAAIPTLEISPGTDEVAAATTAESSPADPEIVTSDIRRPAVVSRQLFIIVASYASAVTLGFIYLWTKMQNGSALDLPDRAPPFDKKTKQVGYRLYPEGALPGSHRLKLGQSKQFGSLMVTPVKVTKGKLEFEHHSGDTKLQISPTDGNVLKLWLKFENVSKDQTFPPLDEDLVYAKVNERSNTFLCQEAERKPQGKKFLVFHRNVESDWLMKGQKLSQDLNPGETFETYIPTDDEPAVGTVEGPLAWRVQFRKGYNRSSFRGVTTVVEVEFDAKEIQADS